jgi:4'-phosphopantetheinyl transferase EntD
MSASTDPLAALLQSLAEPGLFVGHRVIAQGDEEALLADETVHFRNAIAKVRRQSGAARIVARALLQSLGHRDVAITRTSHGAPVWPTGIIGSLAHDERVAVAALARTADFLALGIDIEPAEDLPTDLINFVAAPAEQSRYSHALLRSRQLFVAKEAVYKAVHPLDQIFLDFHDIDVNLEQETARVRYGRTVHVKVMSASHVVALASIKAGQIAPASRGLT